MHPYGKFGGREPTVARPYKTFTSDIYASSNPGPAVQTFLTGMAKKNERFNIFMSGSAEDELDTRMVRLLRDEDLC